MALVSLISQALNLDGRTKIQSPVSDVILVDVTTSLTPKYSTEVTQHPIESGANVSDHIKIKNIEIEIEGIISETPLNFAASVRGAVTSAAGVVGSRIGGSLAGAIGSAVGGLGSSILLGADNPAQIAREQLVKLLNSRKHFKIAAPSLSLESNSNFVLTSLSFPKDSSTGRAIRFKATLQQIQFAQSKIIDVTRFAEDVANTASKQTDQGKRATETVTNGKQQSLLKKGVAYYRGR